MHRAGSERPNDRMPIIAVGALPRNAGRPDMRRTMEAGHLPVVWPEQGAEGMTDTARQGFGTTVVRNAAVRQLKGELESTFAADGMVYRIAIPLANIAPS